MNNVLKAILMVLAFPFLGILLLFKSKLEEQFIIMKDDEIRKDWVVNVDKITFRSLYVIWFNIYREITL